MGTGREKSNGISTGDLKRPPHRVRRGPKPRQHGAVSRGTKNRASSTINAAGWSILNRYSQTSILWRETLRGHEGTTGRCLKTASQTRKLAKNAIIASISHRILLHGAHAQRLTKIIITRTNQLSAAAAAAFFRAFLREDTLPPAVASNSSLSFGNRWRTIVFTAAGLTSMSASTSETS